MHILILGNDSDQHAVHICTALRQRGITADYWDIMDFPLESRCSYWPRTGEIVLESTEGKRIALGDVHAVYWRNFNAPSSATGPDVIARNDSQSLIESVMQSPGCRWVNGLSGYRLHFRKPECLQIATACGLTVPDTIVSNNMADIRDFAGRHPRAIFKPVRGGAHARPLTALHLSDENAASLSEAPVTVQEEIPGTNIRLFIAGEAAFACEIQADTLDFRDASKVRIVSHDLPAGLLRLARQAAQALHLSWTGMDFRRTPDGEYYFLEANFSPMFLEFERQTGFSITDMLVGHLVS